MTRADRIIASLCVTAGIGFMIWEYAPRGTFVPDMEKVHLRMRVDRELCADTPSKPLWAEVENGSDKTIRRARLSIEIHERGDSEDRAGDVMHDLKWTEIVDPGATRSACYPIRLQPGRTFPVDIVTVSKLVHVDFYGSGEAIPR